jgi:hypothetical protein
MEHPDASSRELGNLDKPDQDRASEATPLQTLPQPVAHALEACLQKGTLGESFEIDRHPLVITRLRTSDAKHFPDQRESEAAGAHGTDYHAASRPALAGLKCRRDLGRAIKQSVDPSELVRIPTKPATNSNRKPATDSDLKPAGIPI